MIYAKARDGAVFSFRLTLKTNTKTPMDRMDRNRNWFLCVGRCVLFWGAPSGQKVARRGDGGFAS